MSATKPPELEPALTALLRAERDGPGMRADEKAALWGRLEATMALPPVGAPPAARVASTAAKGVKIILACAGGAAALAAAIIAARSPDPAPSSRDPSSVDAPRSTPAAHPELPKPRSPSASGGASPGIDPATLPDVPVAPPPLAARRRPPSDDDLARERALIEAARAAIRAGAPAEGMRALDEHARSFPQGRLGEEREALRIFALRASGRSAEAATAAAAFRSRYPNSLLLGDR